MKIKRKQYQHRLYKSKITKYVLNLLAIISLIIISSIFLFLGVNVKNNAKPYYSYLVKKSSPYEVSLLPNNFYLENSLPAGRYYASKSIDSFIINFKYSLEGNKQVNVEYTYGITADLVGLIDNGDGNKKEVWTRNYVLQENVTNSCTDTYDFLIDKNINIDYENYNELARSYEKAYGITIETDLKIHFNISYSFNLLGINLSQDKIEDNIELNIPITNTITKVDEDYQNETTQDIFLNNNQLNIIEIIFYILSILFLIDALFVFIIKFKRKNKFTPEENYNHNIKRILKYYRELIVTVSNEPCINNLEVMNIINLNDLIDVAEQNQKNIIHYEVVKNERSNLYVIVDRLVYIYVVTSDKIR